MDHVNRTSAQPGDGEPNDGWPLRADETGLSKYDPDYDPAIGVLWFRRLACVVAELGESGQMIEPKQFVFFLEQVRDLLRYSLGWLQHGTPRPASVLVELLHRTLERTRPLSAPAEPDLVELGLLFTDIANALAQHSATAR